MKTSTLLTAGLFLLLASRSVTATAADPRLSNGYSTAPNRGLFGLPMPQQWSGFRTTGTGYNAGYNTTGYNANCQTGNCQTGYRNQTGYAGQNGSCANGQCANKSFGIHLSYLFLCPILLPYFLFSSIRCKRLL